MILLLAVYNQICTVQIFSSSDDATNCISLFFFNPTESDALACNSSMCEASNVLKCEHCISYELHTCNSQINA